jgi:hypothetical protein
MLVTATDAAYTCAVPRKQTTVPTAHPVTLIPTAIPTAVPTVTVTTPCVAANNLNAKCLGFAVNSRTGITFASGENTAVVGNIGSGPDVVAITGVYALSPGSVILSGGSSESAAFKTAWEDFMVPRAGATDWGNLAVTQIGGKTLTPGVYRAGAALNWAYDTVITFDGPGEYLIQAGTTLTTAASVYTVLINGAKAEDIVWALGTGGTLGAESVLDGSIFAGTAITFGTKSEIRGCAIAQTAVTFEARAYVNVRKDFGGVCSDDGANQADVCENLALHARTTITTLAATTITNGDIGVAPGTSITGAATFLNGAQLATGPTGPTATFALLAVFDHAELRSRRSDETYWGIPQKELTGVTLTPGTYRSGSAINIAAGGTVTLSGAGTYLIQADTTLVTGAGCTVLLTNGAKAENVIWALGTAATLGANTVIQGSILTGTSHTFGANSVVHGCVIAQAAITGADQAEVGLVVVP